MAKSLGSKIINGAFWTVLMRTSIRLLGIVSILILARILTPEDFGIVAKATMIYGFLELLSQFGFENSLIKNQRSTRDDYNTVWTLSIIRGLSIGIILFILAWPLSIIFNEPELLVIIFAYAFISFLRGFINVGIVDFRKELNFHLDFKYNFYNKVSSFLITILIANAYETYWALVIGGASNIISSLILSYTMTPYRPNFSLKKLREIFNFSKWVFTFEFFGAISQKLDFFIIGRYSTTDLLGLYTVSYEISGTPSTEISMPVARAAFPGLSKLSEDIEKFREMYTNTLELVLVIAIPISLGLSAVSQTATLVLLGEKWLNASEFIKILALFGLLRVVYATSISAYMALDRPDILAKLSASILLIRLIFLPIGIYTNGIIGLCWSIVLAACITTSINLYIQNRLKIINFISFSKNIYQNILSSLIMWYMLKYLDFSSINSELIVLFLKVIIGLVIFLISTLVIYKISPRKNIPEEKIYRFLKRRLLNKSNA